MARFIDIFYLVVCISLAIGFANGLFSMATGTTSNYMEAPNLTGSLYTVSDARTTMNGSQVSSTDAFSSGVGLLGMGWGFIMSMLNIFTLYGTLMNTFHVPPLVTVFISGLMGIVYMSFILQFVTGRYFKSFGD